MTLVCAVVPVRDGQEHRVRAFREDMGEDNVPRYEELNRAAGISRHAIWLQPTPGGPAAVHVFELDDPSRFARAFDQSDPFDRWWLDFVRDVHGIDLRAIGLAPGPPEPTFVWEAARG